MYFNGKTSKLYFNKIGFKDRDIGVIGSTGNPMKTGNTASQVS